MIVIGGPCRLGSFLEFFLCLGGLSIGRLVGRDATDKIRLGTGLVDRPREPLTRSLVLSASQQFEVSGRWPLVGGLAGSPPRNWFGTMSLPNNPRPHGPCCRRIAAFFDGRRTRPTAAIGDRKKKLGLHLASSLAISTHHHHHNHHHHRLYAHDSSTS